LENEQLDALDTRQRAELDRLLKNPNVFITPHIAGYSEESKREMCRVVLKKLGF
jgi:D-3-phosphoglycerate dehydrogenase